MSPEKMPHITEYDSAFLPIASSAELSSSAQQSPTVKGHKYFDPYPPEPPAEIFGMPSQALLNASYGISRLYSMSNKYIPGMYQGLQALRSTVQMFPLVEKVQSGQEITPEDVRPYRKPIKQAVGKIGVASAWTAVATPIGIGIPLRRALNRKIETEFVNRAPELIRQAQAKAQEFLPKIEAHIEFMAGFENPRQQYVREITIIFNSIRQLAIKRAQSYSSASPIAEDAGYSIATNVRSILENPEWTKEHMPLLSHFILESGSNNTVKQINLPREEMLAVGSPEIIKSLNAVLPDNQQDQAFVQTIIDNPHPKRRLAEVFASSKLESLERSLRIFQDIKYVLPQSGQQIKDSFDAVKKFLKVS
jgi:hypothetical protein